MMTWMRNMSSRWTVRRRMAWLSLIAALLFPLLVTLKGAEHLAEIAMPFYMFVSTVVGSYIGFATIDDKWSREASDATK